MMYLCQRLFRRHLNAESLIVERLPDGSGKMRQERITVMFAAVQLTAPAALQQRVAEASLRGVVSAAAADAASIVCASFCAVSRTVQSVTASGRRNEQLSPFVGLSVCRAR